MTDYQRFEELSALSKEELHVDNGVGTLSEKYLHIFLKNYFEADKSCHEVKIGRFTADICHDNQIIEVQTRNLGALREKLEYYLLEGFEVTVVHPIPRVRQIFHVDKDTGETVKKRKYPHIGTFFDGIPELYKIKYFLDWERFNVRLLLVDVEEYRQIKGGGVTKSGRRRRPRSERLERIPVEICDSLLLDNPFDYLAFVPSGLPSEFTSTVFAKTAKIPIDYARMTLNILNYLGTVEHIANDGKKYIYRMNKYFAGDFGE